jgi:hypothetical protein
MGWIRLKWVICMYVNITIKPFVELIHVNKNFTKKGRLMLWGKKLRQKIFGFEDVCTIK